MTCTLMCYASSKQISIKLNLSAIACALTLTHHLHLYQSSRECNQLSFVNHVCYYMYTVVFEGKLCTEHSNFYRREIKLSDLRSKLSTDHDRPHQTSLHALTLQSLHTLFLLRPRYHHFQEPFLFLLSYHRLPLAEKEKTRRVF